MTTRIYVQCDLPGCDKVCPPSRRVHLKLDRHQAGVPLSGLDFCSWSHLAEWALARPEAPLERGEPGWEDDLVLRA